MTAKPVPVLLTLRQPANTIRVIDPLLSTNPVRSADNSRDITVELTNHPTLVEIVPKR